MQQDPSRGARPRAPLSRSIPALALILLTAILAGGCTVRLELASPHAVAGDLPAVSAGLAGHRRWLVEAPGDGRLRVREGIAIAAVRPAARAARVVEFLPDVGGGAPATGPDLALGEPSPRLRPDPPGHAVRVAPPLPSPPKPVRIAAVHRPGPAHPWPDPALVFETLRPAAGPPP